MPAAYKVKQAHTTYLCNERSAAKTWTEGVHGQLEEEVWRQNMQESSIMNVNSAVKSTYIISWLGLILAKSNAYLTYFHSLTSKIKWYGVDGLLLCCNYTYLLTTSVTPSIQINNIIFLEFKNISLSFNLVNIYICWYYSLYLSLISTWQYYFIW